MRGTTREPSCFAAFFFLFSALRGQNVLPCQLARGRQPRLSKHAWWHLAPALHVGLCVPQSPLLGHGVVVPTSQGCWERDGWCSLHQGRVAGPRRRAQGDEPAWSVAWARSPLPARPAASRMIHPRPGSQQSRWRPPPPPEAAAVVINIDFAVTHTPEARTDLCQERSPECLSHSRNAAVGLRRGEGQLAEGLG